MPSTKRSRSSDSETKSIELYKVPRKEGGTLVRVLEGVNGPPSSPDFKTDDVVLFFHIDGMYSLCKNREGRLVHLKAWTKVEVLDG